MAFPMLAAFVFASALPPQESVVLPAPRVPLPRPVANAPMTHVNDNRRPAGSLSGGTLTLSLDIVGKRHDHTTRKSGQGPVVPDDPRRPRLELP